MVHFNIRIYAFVILGVALGTYSILFLSTQDLNSIDFHKALSHISTTITINIILWLIFIKWAWKWRIFYPWLVPFPNLSGNWKGTILSNWQGQAQPEKTIEISITQTFFNVQVRMKTDESRSYSIGASFDIDQDRGQQQLFYSYMNTPKASVRERSEMHYGSTVLNFEGFNVKKMEGDYWTSRETTGEIKLTRKNAD